MKEKMRFFIESLKFLHVGTLMLSKNSIWFVASYWYRCFVSSHCSVYCVDVRREGLHLDVENQSNWDMFVLLHRDTNSQCDDVTFTCNSCLHCIRITSLNTESIFNIREFNIIRIIWSITPASYRSINGWVLTTWQSIWSMVNWSRLI